jgi:hypothetical protein
LTLRGVPPLYPLHIFNPKTSTIGLWRCYMSTNKFCGLARFGTADQNRVGHTRQHTKFNRKTNNDENAKQILWASAYGDIGRKYQLL